jgi:hypothetical protein
VDPLPDIGEAVSASAASLPVEGKHGSVRRF